MQLCITSQSTDTTLNRDREQFYTHGYNGRLTMFGVRVRKEDKRKRGQIYFIDVQEMKGWQGALYIQTEMETMEKDII